MASATATRVRPVSRRSANHKAKGLRFVVVEGMPSWDNNPTSPTQEPEAWFLDMAQDLEEYGTIEEALAESRRINEIMLKCNITDHSWTMVVVRRPAE